MIANLQIIAAQWMSTLADYLPVGYAFGAGMVSTVNPCGFAMLPAYISLYLGAQADDFYSRSVAFRGLKALWVATVVSAGFIILFGVAGGVISLGGQVVAEYIPWVALLIGVGLVLIGIWLLTGHYVSAGIFHQLAMKIGDPRSSSVKGYFLFGVAFGAASLSCTLPIFLVVVGSALSTSGFFSSVIQFFSYGLGMAAVVISLTLSVALFKEGLLIGRFRRMMPYVQQVAAAFLILAGGYIVYYWLVQGQLLQSLAAN